MHPPAGSRPHRHRFDPRECKSLAATSLAARVRAGLPERGGGRAAPEKTLRLAQTLVTASHSLSLLTKSFLSGHSYAQLSNFLTQISTRHERGDIRAVHRFSLPALAARLRCAR